MSVPPKSRRPSAPPPSSPSLEGRPKSAAPSVSPPPSNRRLAPAKIRPDVLEAARRIPDDDASVGPTTPRRSLATSPRARAVFSVARTILGGALVLGTSCAVAWGARRYVMESPRFAVSGIAVSGGKQRSNDALVTTAGIAEGQNIFTIDLDRARARLLSDPWISDATLARRLPGTILIQVTEREAGAIVALPETYLASQTGEIFKRLEVGDPVDLPVVTGITSDQVTADRDGVTRLVRRAEDLATDYDHGPLGERAPLEEVHVGQDGSVRLVVGKDGVSIALGAPPFRRKLEEAARVFGELDRRGGKADEILIDNDARPERVVVRMR